MQPVLNTVAALKETNAHYMHAYIHTYIQKIHIHTYVLFLVLISVSG
jgi:hypothetical protein